jgi:hypothetical protein
VSETEVQRPHFQDAAGDWYTGSVSPREHVRGVLRSAHSLCFEHQDGQYLGSVPLYHKVTLERLTIADLRPLLR